MKIFMGLLISAILIGVGFSMYSADAKRKDEALKLQKQQIELQKKEAIKADNRQYLQDRAARCGGLSIPSNLPCPSTSQSSTNTQSPTYTPTYISPMPEPFHPAPPTMGITHTNCLEDTVAINCSSYSY